MTRRTLMGIVPGVLFAQGRVQQSEFDVLYNDLVADMNLLMAGHIRGKWDVKLAAQVEKDFQKLTEDPGWVSLEKKKGSR